MANTKIDRALSPTLNRGDALEAMVRAYWNAYREGVMAVGGPGTAAYPTWDEFSEIRAKNETRRCMRYAIEALNDLPDSAFIDKPAKTADDKKHVTMERGSLSAVLGRAFPEKPMRRKAHEKLQAEIAAEHLNRASGR